MSSSEKITSDYYPGARQIALFLDADNLGIRCKSGREVNQIIDNLTPWGRVVVRRAYGCNLRSKQYIYKQLLRGQFHVGEIRRQIPHKKNAADIRIAVEAMELLLTRPDINTFAIASGDSDYIELVRRIHNHRRRVIGIGSRKSSSQRLQQCCDVFLFYENICRSISVSNAADIVAGSTLIKTDPETMRTWLRHCKILPPSPPDRHKILSHLQSLAKTRQTGHASFAELQQKLIERCHRDQISNTAVRNCMRILTRAGLIVSDEDRPLSERLITTIPTLKTMQTAITKIAVTVLLSDPKLVADPLAMSEAIWDDTTQVNTIARLIRTRAQETQPLTVVGVATGTK